MIAETITFLKERGRHVFFDAEHFFDGIASDSKYAINVIKTAFEAGAERIVLCDTNGGSFTDDVAIGVTASKNELGLSSCIESALGIHAHNDSGLAAACTIAAVKAGARHVQGTMAGFGERCGNTRLSTVIPSMEIKLKLQCLPADHLKKITDITRTVAEIANISLPDNLPYVGRYAFAHKAGMHADGILKTSKSFEHIDPDLTGNDRHFLMSEIGGRAAVAEKIKKIEPEIKKEDPAVAAIADKLKILEAKGWQFDGAEGSFELLVRRELKRYEPLFEIAAYRVLTEHPTGDAVKCCNAWVKVLVDGQNEIAAAEGDGPVMAIDLALRRALKRFYPELEKVRLQDYKVRVINGKDGTASKVRVLIESTDGKQNWSTVGVSEDIIDASRAALVDALEYKLIGDIERRFKVFL
jgi:2-isopropylmalate synthase